MYQKIKLNSTKPMKIKSKLNKKFIPVSIPYISNQDIKSVSKVLKKVGFHLMDLKNHLKKNFHLKEKFSYVSA